jgi:hypothetical protein
VNASKGKNATGVKKGEFNALLHNFKREVSNEKGIINQSMNVQFFNPQSNPSW